MKYDEEDDGCPYYGEFGLKKIRGAWRMPLDRASRAESLRKLVEALPKHKLDQLKYGTAFWAPIATGHAALAGSSAQTTGQRAVHVADKGTLREQVEEVLLVLLSLLRANYSKTHKAERRKFGFLKESY
jgi:hypothetical protein